MARHSLVQAPASYMQACASCHTAYPPGLLPARSWQRIMQGLDTHFGSDASLDATTVQQLSSWLQANAGHSARVANAPAQDRLTRSVWLERKHRHIPAAVWKLPSVKSASQCAACHIGAEHGQFSDEQLRMPAGLSASQQRAWKD